MSRNCTNTKIRRHISVPRARPKYRHRFGLNESPKQAQVRFSRESKKLCTDLVCTRAKEVDISSFGKRAQNLDKFGWLCKQNGRYRHDLFESSKFSPNIREA